jgi:hypothetical protein
MFEQLKNEIIRRDLRQAKREAFRTNASPIIAHGPAPKPPGIGIGARWLVILMVIGGVVAGLYFGGVIGKHHATRPHLAYSAKEIAYCEADARALTTAVARFDANHPTSPIERETGIQPGNPISYQDGTQALRLRYGHYVANWPPRTGEKFFSLALSSTHPGDVVVFSPAGNLHSTDYRFETPTTGCQDL